MNRLERKLSPNLKYTPCRKSCLTVPKICITLIYTCKLYFYRFRGEALHPTVVVRQSKKVALWLIVSPTR